MSHTSLQLPIETFFWVICLGPHQGSFSCGISSPNNLQSYSNSEKYCKLEKLLLKKWSLQKKVERPKFSNKNSCQARASDSFVIVSASELWSTAFLANKCPANNHISIQPLNFYGKIDPCTNLNLPL